MIRRTITFGLKIKEKRWTVMVVIVCIKCLRACADTRLTGQIVVIIKKDLIEIQDTFQENCHKKELFQFALFSMFKNTCLRNLVSSLL